MSGEMSCGKLGDGKEMGTVRRHDVEPRAH
jgi:hypothetical protein